MSDLEKASPQSRSAVCERIIYESATSKAEVVQYLQRIQDRITGAYMEATVSNDTSEKNDEEVMSTEAHVPII